MRWISQRDSRQRHPPNHAPVGYNVGGAGRNHHGALDPPSNMRGIPNTARTYGQPDA